MSERNQTHMTPLTQSSRTGDGNQNGGCLWGLESCLYGTNSEKHLLNAKVINNGLKDLTLPKLPLYFQVKY